MNLVDDFKDDPEVIAVLDGADYWKWRTSIEELKNSQMKVEMMTAKDKANIATVAMQQMQANLFKQQVKSSQDNKLEVERQYKEEIKRLEDKYKISLSDCIIGDVNYEVRKTTI